MNDYHDRSMCSEFLEDRPSRVRRRFKRLATAVLCALLMAVWLSGVLDA